MLQSYSKKRDFDRTPEPDATGPPGSGRNLRFVVQKHAARRLHYDFRLEVDGVLKSWPVPKGPSFDPREKRLAVMVEDHPFEYRTFEGIIPKGSYGAGQVIVWDEGVYSPDEGGRLSFGDPGEAGERMRQGLNSGKLSITLRGHKLRGSWTLVKTTRGPNEWLLIKHADRHADDSLDILEQDRSVVSGLTIADLKSGRLPDPAKVVDPSAGTSLIGREAPFPANLKPMMARLVEEPFSHPGWLFEPKLDGYRAVAFLRKGGAVLRSRTGKDLTPNFPEVVEELSQQPEDELVLDGEIVALDDRGLPDFALLQQRVGYPSALGSSSRSATSQVVYYAFDMLHADGRDLTQVPLIHRKALLSRTVLPADTVQVVEHVDADGEAFFQGAAAMGLEGMVAKKRDSVYEAGARSGSWRKVKRVQAQEFVVSGYTRGAGARAPSFGALLLGYYEDDRLVFAGKAGSGFDAPTLESLKTSLDGLETSRMPFDDAEDIDEEEPTWVTPDMVVQVKFAQWTDDDRLRAPVFMGVRPEVSPLTVVRERAEPAEPLADDGAEHDSVGEVLEQLSGAREKMVLEVEGHRISVTNLDKVFWPATGDRSAITKRDMIAYYTRMGPVLLPHLRDRPLTLTRYPNGILGKSFYQKHWESDKPEFVETVRLYSSHNEGDVDYIAVNNLPTLVWLAQIADLELHPWLSRTSPEPDGAHLTTDFEGSGEAIDGSLLSYPDFIVFDLDPYIYSGREKKGEEPELNRRAFTKVREVALDLKDILDEMSLSSFPKTSGKTGLHIYVPVLRHYNFGAVRKTCELIGRFLMQGRPDDVTMEWTVSKRPGKIFLDHNQNVRGKNMASIYSLRPLPHAPVSTPVRWDELSEVYPTDFTIDTVPPRVEEMGDLWSDMLGAKHDLRRILESE